jgi:putrescine transport system substrate-binding protein
MSLVSTKKLLFTTLFFCVVAVVFWTIASVKTKYVNVYDWYGVLPRKIITQFEEETGITVHYDVFDNNEILEAKLLASNSGYDVVFPTVFPYAARQLHLKVYQKINKKLLPNLKEIEPILVDKMKAVDPKLEFLLPYYWGTTGIAFDEDKLNKILPNIPKDGNHLLFDVGIVEKLKPFGISILQEPVDVFPPYLEFIGVGWHNKSFDNLWLASRQLFKICSNVKRFSSARFITDLVTGEVCIAQAWSGEALKAIEEAKKVGKRIKYILPKDGASIWIDAIAIPVGAPNVGNAHAFINFLLRPDISAEITNNANIATMVVASKKHIKKKILENELIFPPKTVLEKLHMSEQASTPEDGIYERVRMRMWTQIKKQSELDRKSVV